MKPLVKVLEILLLAGMVMLLMGADRMAADSKDERFQRLGSKIMCSCGCSQMLLKCNHVNCPSSDPMIRQLRALVGGGGKEILNGQAGSASDIAGLQPLSSDEDVLNWFRQNWGVTAVVEPGTRGFEFWAWAMPVIALALGTLLVIFTVRNWRHRPALAQGKPAKIDPHMEALRDRARRETEI